MTTKEFNDLGLKIHLIDELENLKSSWGVWSCEVEDKDGNLKAASIQTDKHMFAYETLEYDEE